MFLGKNESGRLNSLAPTAHNHTFDSLTGKPTTIAGYGITDAYTKTESNANYEPKDTAIVKSNVAEVITAQWTFHRVGENYILKGTATGDSATPYLSYYDSSDVRLGRIGYISNANGALYIRNQRTGGSLFLGVDDSVDLTIVTGGAATFVSTCAATSFIEGGTALSSKYKATFSENTGFNKNFGTIAGTVSEGDHLHTGVYEPYDLDIVKADVNETIQVSWNFNAATGIGAPTPLAPLHIRTTAAATLYSAIVTSTSYQLRIENTSSTAATFADIHFVAGDADAHISFERVSTNNGKLHFKVDSTSTALTISDDNTIDAISTITATNFIDGSDKRLKKDVDPICECYLDRFDKIKPIQYRLKDGNDNFQFGVIAQDIEKIYPNVVSTNEKGYKGVNYRSLAMLTLSKVQEQQKEIEALTDRLNKVLGEKK